MFFAGIVLSHLLLFSYSPVECGLLIPEELPSFLSLLYSIVPPLRIGKDSRFGAGFRIGPNADLQFLVELGPQQNTLPIGPGPPSDIDDALPGVRRHVGSTSTTVSPPPRRRLPTSSSTRNWGLNYIPNRRQKEPINQTVPNNSKPEAAKLFWRGKSHSQNNVKHQTSASTQRKIVRLPDSLIVYNNTQLPTNTDVEMITSQENFGNVASVEDSNKVQKLTSKEPSTNNLVNKSNGLNSNQILEESIQNRTSLRKLEKKRNEQLQQQTNQRPRALRDWVFSWFDGLKPSRSGSA